MVFAYLRRSSWKLDLVLIFNLRKSLSEINGECITDNIKLRDVFIFRDFMPPTAHNHSPFVVRAPAKSPG